MMIPFVTLYTKGVTDVNYTRPLFSFLLILGGVFNCFRVPYRAITIVAGHYKQTRNGAILEAIINITVSVLGVIFFGLIGVALGTLCAMAFRTIQYVLYLSNNIMNRDVKYFLRHAVLCFAIMGIVYFVSQLYLPSVFDSWTTWIIYATITTLIAIALTLGTDYLFYKHDMENLFVKVKNNLFRKKVKAE